MHLSHRYCIVAVCLAFTGSSNGGGVLQQDLLNGTEGRGVLFRTQHPPDILLTQVLWEVPLQNGSSISIIQSSPNIEDIVHPEYSSRIILNKLTGSLELFNLTLDDSGSYEVIIVPKNGHLQRGVCALQVYEPVSNVTVTPNTTDLLEFNSSVSLSCSVSTGTSLSYLWMNDSAEITASSVGVQIGPGGTNLTVLNVTRYDRGPYHCRVFNPVSSETSDPLTLHPIYGPDNITIDGPAELKTGQLLKLCCRVESTPPAEFTWMRGNQIIGNGTEFIKNATVSDNGEFTCSAENNVTGLFVVAVHRLSVTEPVDSGLSPGALAGIIIGVILVVVGVGGLVYHFYRRSPKKAGMVNLSIRGTANGGYVRDSTLSTKDMNYADIRHFKKNDDVGVKTQNQDAQTATYSEIKRPAT